MCGNCHHKEISPTTGDQTQLPPKTNESKHQVCPLGSKQFHLITYRSENDVQKFNLISKVLST